VAVQRDDGDPSAPPSAPATDHSVLVRVADVDAHCARATAGGARIVRPPTDYPYGERQYTAVDPGGHAWTFSQSVADVHPATWGGTLVEAPEPTAESQEQYKARILGFVAGRDPLTLLAAAPDTLAALVDGLPASVLDRRPAPSKWSIREIVAHLADDELVGAYRIRLILSAPGTAIQAFDQDVWAEAGRYATTDVTTSLALFRQLREENLRLLHALRDDEWERFGIHAERGRESVRDIAAYYAGHDLNHFAQIERQRAAAPAAPPARD
jgi:hypothetical protein